MLLCDGAQEESLTLNWPNATGTCMAGPESLYSWAEHIWMYCNCCSCICAKGFLAWRPLIMWSLSICVSVCWALQNQFKAFGNGLFLYWECCMRWLTADLAARLMFLVHDLTEHCNYSHKRLVLILGLAFDLNCRLLEYWWYHRQSTTESPGSGKSTTSLQSILRLLPVWKVAF